MPLYEYRCTECGNRYEKIQKINDLQDVACPKCGGKVIRPLTAPALQFKGSGFYINDYAPKASGGSAGSSEGSSGGDGARAGSGSSTPESKPAATENKPSSSNSGTNSGGNSGSSPASSSTPAS